jgi:hypothetical protein
MPEGVVIDNTDMETIRARGATERLRGMVRKPMIII